MQTTEKPEIASLRTAGAEYLALWDRIEKLKAEAKALEEQADAKELEMVETLQGIGEKVFHLDGGVGRFQLDPQLYVQVNADDRPAVIEWLKADPDGAALVEEAVNTQRLKAFVKECVQKGKQLHGMIKVNPMTQIKFVKAK